MIDSLSGSGGAEHGLVREITQFSKTVDQHVCRLFASDQLEAELVNAGISVSSLGLSSSAAGWNWPVAAGRLVRLIRAYEPDVLHSSLFMGNLVTQLAGVVTRTAVLSTFTLSGDPTLLRAYQPGADTWKASTLRWFAARLARSKQVWFRSISQDALDTNARLLGVSPERAVVIPRGVPIPLLSEPPQSRAQLGLPDSGRILLNVGRQTAQKGHLSLLEAFSEVRRHVDAHLVICGREGDASAATHARIHELRVEDHVTLIGYTPLVHHYLARADVFVFSSLMEGLGTAIIEAMASGVPIVAFDIPPVREATQDGRGARLVPVGDANSLADAIREMLDSSVAAPYVQSGTRIVEERYSLAIVAAQLEQRLREVAAK